MLENIKTQAAQNNESVRRFTEGCFKVNPGDPQSAAIPDAIVTFDGHGTLDKHEKYTPQQFVDLITAEKVKKGANIINNPYKLPQAVQVIEFIGCNIGLRPAPDKISYVEQVVEMLAKKSGYEHIQVRAFVYPNEYVDETHKETKYASLLVFGISGRALLLTKTESVQHTQLMRIQEQLTSEIKVLRDQKAALVIDYNEARTKLASYQNSVTDYNRLINSYKYTPKGYISKKEVNVEQVKRLSSELNALENRNRDLVLRYEATVNDNQPRIAQLINSIKTKETELNQNNKQITDLRSSVRSIANEKNIRHELNQDKFIVRTQAEQAKRKKPIEDEKNSSAGKNKSRKKAKSAQENPHEVPHAEIQESKTPITSVANQERYQIFIRRPFTHEKPQTLPRNSSSQASLQKLQKEKPYKNKPDEIPTTPKFRH